MTERLACKTPGCKGQILPATALKTGGFCMPCFQAARRAERDEFISRNRVDVDRFAGLTDPVEIISIIHQRLTHDPLKNYLPYRDTVGSLYRELSAADGIRLFENSLDDEDLVKEVAAHLALFTTLDLEMVQLHLIAGDDPYPGYVFRYASKKVVQRLLDGLRDAKETLRLDHLLSALAWTKHADALEQFQTWRVSPPAWASNLYIPVHRYTEVAGYEVRQDGVRRLYFERCFRLRPLQLVEQSLSEPAVLICQRAPEPNPCLSCGVPGVVLLRFTAGELLGEDWDDRTQSIQIPTCLDCTCFRVIYTKSEGVSWHWIDTAEDFAPHPKALVLPPHSSDLASERGPFEAADWLRAEGISQLGGLPSCINDPQYPQCPSCQELMPFVGQVAVEDLIPGEGIFYAFFCEACRTTATTYDQT